MDHINCNNCGEKGHHFGNSYCLTQSKLKEDVEAFRKMNQDKSSNKPLEEETRKHWWMSETLRGVS